MLSPLISHGQSAFIHGRSISHNILLMQGLLKGYGRKNITPRVAFKIDIRKAFDSVKWQSIHDFLVVSGFPFIFTDWIMQCVTTPHFIVSVNGIHDGYFKGESGVRQGDPLSSYLFVAIMEIFNCIFKMLLKTHPFKFHPHCKEEEITHVCFADDLFIMANADKDSIQTIREALNLFSNVTGLEINEGKSLAFYGGVMEDGKNELFNVMRIQEGALPVKYLGVPLSSRQIYVSHCRPLIDKVKNSVLGWATKRLSYAGRLELVTKVIMGIVAPTCL